MKSLKVVLMAMLAAGLFAACGGSSEGTDGGSDQSASDVGQEKFEHMLERFDSPARDDWQQPDKVVVALGDLKGKTVADVGAGSGYFTFRLAETADKVIAIDVDQRFIDHINSRKESEGKANVETRLATTTDPKLELGEADRVLVVNVLHLVDDKLAWLKKLQSGMSEGSLLLVVDYKKKSTSPDAPAPDQRLGVQDVFQWVTRAGFDKARVDMESLEHQFMVKALKGSLDAQTGQPEGAEAADAES